MKVVKSVEGLVVMKNAMYNLGYLPREDRCSIFQWRCWMSRLHLLRAFYVFVSNLINMYLTSRELEKVTAFLFMTGAFGLGLFKLGTLVFKGNEIKMIISHLEEVHEKSARNSDQNVIRYLDWSYQTTYLVFKCFLIFSTCFVTFLSLSLVPEALNKRKIPFSLWYPWDFQIIPVLFETALVISTVLNVIDVMLMVFSDLLFAGIVLFLAIHFKALCLQISNITSGSLDESGRKNGSKFKDFVVRLNESERNKNAEHKTYGGQSRSLKQFLALLKGLREIVVTLWNPTGGDHKFKQTVCELSTASKDILSHKRAENHLRSCVIDHMILLRLNKEIEAVYNEMLLFQLLCNVCCGLAVIPAILLSDAHVSSFLVQICLISGCYWELCLYSAICDILLTWSFKVKDAIYGCDWLVTSNSFKRSMRIIISRANQPAVIRAAGFIPVTMETFYSASCLAYKFMMAMRSSIKSHY